MMVPLDVMWSLWAGQSAGLIEEVLPAGEIVRRIADEAAAILRSGAGVISR